MNAEQVIYRLAPCGCGCGGRDPWHKSTFWRIVDRQSDVAGTVRLPCSSMPVVVRRKHYGVSDRTGEAIYGPWIVDRASIQFDR